MKLHFKWIALAMCLIATNGLQAQDTLTITLQDAIDIALSENPTIKVANQEIALKKEANKELWWGLFPEVSLSGSYSRAIEKQSFAMQGQVIKVGTLNTMSGGLVAGLPVYAPTLWRSINLTKNDVKLAVEKSRESKLSLVNQVTKAFYQLLLAQDSHAVLLRSYQQASDNYDVINAKFGQGKVSEYDRISAEVQMRSIKPSVVSAANGVTLAMMQLKVLMGIESESPVKIAGNLKDYEHAVFANEAQPQMDWLDNNSTLKQLGISYDTMKKNIKLKKANFLPTLSASFQYMYTSMNEKLHLAHYIWNPYSTVGLTLSIPLFKGANNSQLRQAKIQLAELEQNMINTRRQIDMQATSYRNNMAASTEQVLSNREAINQAVKGRDIAEKRYEVGRGTILELNSSEVALTQAELVYNQSIFDYLSAKADLDLVLGVEDVRWNENK